MAGQRATTVEAANNFGNPVNIDRATFDIASDFLVADLNDSAPHAGTIDSFRVRRQSGSAGIGQSVRFVILDSQLVVKWVSGSFIIPPGASDSIRFDIPGGAAVAAGDYIGMYFPGTGAVAFDSVGSSRFSTIGIGGPPAVGFDLVANEHGASPQARTYGFRAIYGCGAVCYVNATTGDDANNHGTSPVDAFQTIQAAVDAVQVGGTVIVAAGNYVESVQIERAVTVQGPNVGKKGNDPARVGEAVVSSASDAFHVHEASNVTIDGFTMAGNVDDGVYAHDSTNVVVKNNIVAAWGLHGVGFELDTTFGVNGGRIERNLFTLSGGGPLSNNRHAIQVDGSSGIVIDDNVVNNYAADEVIVVENTTTSTISRNLVTGNSCGTAAAANCQATLLLDFVNTILVAENDITGSDQDGGVGLLIRAGSQSVTVRNNIFRAGMNPTVLAGTFAGSLNSNIVFTLNDFSSAMGPPLTVGLGIGTASTVNPVNAEKNWWGSNTGPSAPLGTGTGAIAISGGPAVDIDPWLCQGVDTSPAIGFQPLSTIALAHFSPCDTTPPAWTVSFKKHAMAPGSYVPAAPGPWSNKVVYMEFQCTDQGANQSGIAQKQGDMSVTFNDGTWTQANIPWAEGTVKGDVAGEYCIDKAGNIAAPLPLLTGGQSVRVDTKAPVCKATPATTWVPKNATTPLVVVPVSGLETGSGIVSTSASVAVSGSAQVLGGTFIVGGSPNVEFHAVNVKMPNTTAGKVTITNLKITDAAGNVGTCSTFYIRGN